MTGETEAARAKVRAQRAARDGGLPQSPEEWAAYVKKNQETREKEERSRRQAASKEAARQHWIRTGGLAQEFEQSYSEIHREQNKTRLLEAEARARSAQAANIKNNF